MIWVIIPAYNEELALPKTVQSVFQQTEPFRVIVVDGGSTDRTPDLIRRLYPHQNAAPHK